MKITFNIANAEDQEPPWYSCPAYLHRNPPESRPPHFLPKKLLLLTLIVANLIWNLVLVIVNWRATVDRRHALRQLPAEHAHLSSREGALLYLLQAASILGLLVYLVVLGAIHLENFILVTIFVVSQSVGVLMYSVLAVSSSSQDGGGGGGGEYPVKAAVEALILGAMIVYWTDLYRLERARDRQPESAEAPPTISEPQRVAHYSSHAQRVLID